MIDPPHRQNNMNENQTSIDTFIDMDELNQLQQQTRDHLVEHCCGAYTFNDGEGLMRIVSQYVMANELNTVPRILELGCALGYSAACMASASPNALIDSIEMDDTHVMLARQNLTQLGLHERVKVHQGQFDAVIPNLVKGYDAVFFDGFAPHLNLLQQIYRLLNPNGILIFANLGLAHGEDLRALNRELNHTERWQKLDSIEHHSTQVLRRI
jgi:protein-L-isoaspartate O-methyltransferase